LTVIGVRVAGAHADLIEADPAPGSTVDGSPKEIRLTFSQPLDSSSRIDLFVGQFQAITGVTTVVSGSEMRAIPAQALEPGTYTLQWWAVADDGHTTQGSFQFGVARSAWFNSRQLAPLLAAVATLIGAGVALFVWNLNRRQRF
jgi:methionine-rich copper-binding protein CopC